MVFDLRGAPANDRTRLLLGHLAEDTLLSGHWNVPYIIYPDRERIVGWDTRGRWRVPPRTPRLQGQAVFLTGPGALRRWAVPRSPPADTPPPSPGSPPGSSPVDRSIKAVREGREEANRVWLDLQSELAELSTDAVHVGSMTGNRQVRAVLSFDREAAPPGASGHRTSMVVPGAHPPSRAAISRLRPAIRS